MLNNVAKMFIFSHFRTNNPIMDAILSTVVYSVVGYISQLFVFTQFPVFSLHSISDAFKSAIYRKYSVTYEGKHNFIIPKFESTPIISVCFTDSFKALLFDILNDISTNCSVCEIKEYITHKRYTDLVEDMYIITQRYSFLYNTEKKIYAKIDNYTEDNDSAGNGDKKTGTSKTNNIIITLYSYHSNIKVIRDHVEFLKTKYIKHIENVRHNKKFIYKLCKANYTDSKFECWKEYPFESSKKFENMFFDGKAAVLEKIRFFLENKDWYYANGIPYTLGIGLSGKPGTGKTSFFKCLAEMTGRHVVIISLKLIKTKQQLESLFLEDNYNENNKNGIGFDKKILFLEDIDCMGDIVLDRDLQKKENRGASKKKEGNVVQQLIQYNESVCEKQNNDLLKIAKSQTEDAVTLDDILNLLDGLHETPGRILGISSNHYSKLDPALTRPGRIDITLKMKNASHNTIREMFQHHYGMPIDEDKLKKIKPRVFSPAKLINIYIFYKDDPDAFLDTLIVESLRF